jgi:ribosomal protein S18 acetylase RimI-like enzyme
MTFRPMTHADADAVADIHAASIDQGFLVRLGRRFLRQLYLGIASDAGSRVFVAVDGQQIVGFAAFSRDVGAMYRHVLRSRFFRLGLAAVPAALNPFLVREIFDTLRYPAKQHAQRLPAAEILSIAIRPGARGGGVGRRLLDELYGAARAAGVDEVKVLAGARLEGANRFYAQCGFVRCAEIIQHGEPLNVYVRRLD